MKLDPDPDLPRWCLARVRAHLARHGVRLTQAGDGLGNLYVSIDEVEAVLGGRGRFDLIGRLGLPPPDPAGPPPCGAGTPLGALVERFGLTPVDAALLAAAAGASLAVDVARLYTFAWADFAIKLPPVSFLAELVSDGADEALGAVGRLRPDRPLRRAGLVRLVAADAWGAGRAPSVHRGVLVPDPVLAFLRGEPAIEAHGAALYGPADAPDAAFDPPPGTTARIERWLADGRGALLLVGPPGSGRGPAAHRACHARGLPLVVLDAGRLPEDPGAFDDALGDLLLDARLRGAVVSIDVDGLLDDAERAAQVASVRRRVAGHGGPVLLALGPAAPSAALAVPDAPRIDFPRPAAPTQAALWHRALGDAALGERLAARFDVTPGVLLEAVADARREAGIEADAEAGAPDEGRIADALRRRMLHALDGLCDPVQTGLTWSDAVLPDDVVERLREIRAHARHRAQVFDRWGFRRKVTYGRGLSCLFSGPPGTGKTMMAGVIAHDLGRELYRVDLSRVVSKWVGETEKNLGRIFDEAARAQAILFFDEADSLFSARTEVKGANDRFANMEVNYLLQRMEQFEGVSILTTNFERGLDEAFRRRLRFKVHFPMPDTDLRCELWRRMVPPQMPIEGEIDFDALGRKFKMSGGNIKNAVLRAAFFAAEEAGGLSMQRLRRAADAESREMGRL